MAVQQATLRMPRHPIGLEVLSVRAQPLWLLLSPQSQAMPLSSPLSLHMESCHTASAVLLQFFLPSLCSYSLQLLAARVRGGLSYS